MHDNSKKNYGTNFHPLTLPIAHEDFGNRNVEMSLASHALSHCHNACTSNTINNIGTQSIPTETIHYEI